MSEEGEQDSQRRLRSSMSEEGEQDSLLTSVKVSYD
jgi:hypothetical protein